MIGEETRKPPIKVDLNTSGGEEIVSKTIYKDTVSSFLDCICSTLSLTMPPACAGNGSRARPETRHQEVLPDRHGQHRFRREGGQDLFQRN